MNVIIDTDALLGLFNAKDALHRQSLTLAEKLLKNKANIFILPTTLAEFALLASSRVGLDQTQTAIKHLSDSDYLPVEISENITKEAVTSYLKQTSKEESLFDCYVMAGAKIVRADFIFSFDQGYKKNGFFLASSLA